MGIFRTRPLMANQSGFTALELLVVVLCLTILAALVLWSTAGS